MNLLETAETVTVVTLPCPSVCFGSGQAFPCPLIRSLSGLPSDLLLPLGLGHQPLCISWDDACDDEPHKLFSLESFSWFWWLIWQLFCYLKLSYKEVVLRYLLNSQLASLKITSLKKQANRSTHVAAPDESEFAARVFSPTTAGKGWLWRANPVATINRITWAKPVILNCILILAVNLGSKPCSKRGPAWFRLSSSSLCGST